jgi:hypothetical protein
VDFTSSQKRKFTEALNEAWKLGQTPNNKNPNPNAPPIDFNATARNFFEKVLKVDVGGQFKDSKNDFRSTIEEALKTGDTNSAIKALEEKLLGKLDADGRRVNSEIANKLEYIVRDNIYRSQNFSRSLRMQEEGIYRVEIVAILDQRTSEICKSLNGKTVELKTVNTYIQNFLSDDPERPGFWQDRKNPTDYAVRQLGFDKMTGDEILSHLGHKAPPFHIRCRTTVVASFDIIAKSVTEAQDIARSYGIAKNVDYTGVPLKYANEINKSLIDLKNKYNTSYDEIRPFYKYETKIVNGKEIIELPIMQSNSSRLSVNTAFFDKLGNKPLDKIIARQNEAKFMNSKNFLDLVAHEFGHKLTAKNLSLAKGDSKDSILGDEYITSKYSGLTDGEKLAEIFVLINQGKKVDKKFLEIFNTYSEVKIE